MDKGRTKKYDDIAVTKRENSKEKRNVLPSRTIQFYTFGKLCVECGMCDVCSVFGVLCEVGIVHIHGAIGRVRRPFFLITTLCSLMID
jgi:hypothetical protein